MVEETLCPLYPSRYTGGPLRLRYGGDGGIVVATARLGANATYDNGIIVI